MLKATKTGNNTKKKPTQKTNSNEHDTETNKGKNKKTKLNAKHCTVLLMKQDTEKAYKRKLTAKDTEKLQAQEAAPQNTS